MVESPTRLNGTWSPRLVTPAYALTSAAVLALAWAGGWWWLAILPVVAATALIGWSTRVTERRARDQLGASEARYRTIVEGQVELVCRYRADGTITYVNRAFAAMLGIPSVDLVGTNFLPPVAALIGVTEANKDSALDPVPSDDPYEQPFILPDGSIRMIQWTNRAIVDDQRLVLEYQAIGRDVTRQVEAGRAAREIQERFQFLADHIAEVFFIIRARSLELIYLSPAFEPMFGRKGNAATLTDLSRLVHPDDRAKLHRLMDRHRHGDLTLFDRAFEVRLLGAGGDSRWFRIHGRVARDESGVVAQYVGLVSEVTDQKRIEEELSGRVGERTRALEQANRQLQHSELEFRQLAENIVEVFWIWSPHARNEGLYLSPAYSRIWGREPVSDPNIAFAGTVHPDDRPAWHEASARQRAGEVTELEYRIVRPDGTFRWILDRAFPLRGLDGTVERVTGVAGDVTARRQAAEEAARHREELGHAARLGALAEMATAMAHELNQPLASISNYAMGCARRLRNRPEPEADLVNALEEVARQARRGGQIIKSIRDLIGKRNGEPVALDVNALARQVARHARPDLDRIGAELALELDPSAPIAFADPIQLELVLLNLVRNASEALAQVPTPTRRLAIRTEGDDGKLRVSVCDNGPGLDADSADRLFDPFYTTKPGGMGMGLAICRSVVEAHGGTLRADTAPGGGARFQFQLPRTAGRD